MAMPMTKYGTHVFAFPVFADHELLPNLSSGCLSAKHVDGIECSQSMWRGDCTICGHRAGIQKMPVLHTCMAGTENGVQMCSQAIWRDDGEICGHKAGKKHAGDTHTNATRGR